MRAYEEPPAVDRNFPGAMKPLRSPRKRPQQRRSQATVDAILDAAVHVFRETGFAAATTNAVATRAGVSIGSLYQYFPNKLALLEALRERHVRELSAAIGLACDEACALPWPAALRHVVTRCRAYNRRHLPLLGILHRELPVPSHAADRLALAHSTRQHQLRKLLEAHRASITVGVDQALFMLPALARGIFSAAALEQPDAVEDEKFVDEIMAVMLGYLA